MKQSFWKKILVFCGLGIGCLGLCACQTTSKDTPVIDKDLSTFQVMTAEDGKKYPRIKLIVNNTTIYDTKEFKVDVLVTYNDETPQETKSYTSPLIIGHGASGGILFSPTSEDYRLPDNTKSISFEKFTPTFFGVWETYLAWWIVAIVIVGISLIGNLIAVSKKNITIQDLRNIYASKLASSVSISIFILIICLFPLIFGSWVASLILLGALLSTVVVTGIVTWIRGLFIKKPPVDYTPKE